MQSIKYLSAAASLAAVADAQTPQQYKLAINNLVPTVEAYMQDQSLNLSIEVNGNNNLVFGSSCMQKVDLTTEAACSA